MAIETDVIRRVFATGEQVFLEIGPWPEAPNDTLELRTADAASKDWFGNISIVLSTDYAIALGNALIASANEKKANT